MTRKQRHLLTRIIVAAVLFLAGSLLHLPELAEMAVFLVCYVVVGWDSDVLHIRKALIDRFQDTEQIICFQHQGIPVLQEAGSNLFPPVKLGLPPNIFDGFIDGAHGEAHGFIKPAEIALVPMASPCDPD